ncbi:hypothetical protein GGC64_003062 [Mycobacterium sp. OAS707]|nr:hypothetical protein [Mycobacterium sp. OAS707]
MQPRHQGYTLGESDGSHVANCATNTHTGPNRDRFARRVSKSRLWETGLHDSPNGSY